MQNSDKKENFFDRWLQRNDGFAQKAAAWLGYGDAPDAPKTLFYPEDLQLALYDQELANHHNLHLELADGVCSCGLVLQYKNIPVQAQSGHVWEDEPVSVIMFDSADGLKLQCQECLHEWQVFNLTCDHSPRTEAAQCHYCMHAIVERANEKGCKGHKQELGFGSLKRQVFSLAQPGIAVYWFVLIFTWIVEIVGAWINPQFHSVLPKTWILLAATGGIIWLMALYIDAEEEKKTKLKRRAIGTWIWSAFMLAVPWLLMELLDIYYKAADAIGFH